jgi:hypothetical protein
VASEKNSKVSKTGWQRVQNQLARYTEPAGEVGGEGLDRGREGSELHEYIPSRKAGRMQGSFVAEFGVGRKRERGGDVQKAECIAIPSAKPCRCPHITLR